MEREGRQAGRQGGRQGGRLTCNWEGKVRKELLVRIGQGRGRKGGRVRGDQSTGKPLSSTMPIRVRKKALSGKPKDRQCR